MLMAILKNDDGGSQLFENEVSSPAKSAARLCLCPRPPQAGGTAVKK